MKVKQLIVGFNHTNCYLVTCEETSEAVVIDPDLREGEDKEILADTAQQGLKLRYIINTHAHIDHIGGNGVLKKATGAEILIQERDALLLTEPWLMFVPPCPACGGRELSLEIMKEQERATAKCLQCGLTLEAVASPPADRILHDGDLIKAGALKLEVIHTPGHSEGSISLYCQSEDIVFSGDTLFAGRVGSTGQAFSSFKDMVQSFKKLMKLPEHTIVYPGHGEKTTIGKEKREKSILVHTGQVS